MTPDADPICSLSNLVGSLGLPMSDPFQSHGIHFSRIALFYVAILVVWDGFSWMAQVLHVRFGRQTMWRATS